MAYSYTHIHTHYHSYAFNYRRHDYAARRHVDSSA